MKRVSVHTDISDNRINITIHDCPKDVFDKLNLVKKQANNVVWKEFAMEGFEITFYSSDNNA